eukprot:6202592-Pleurochrysis_carterae.AAC.8
MCRRKRAPACAWLWPRAREGGRGRNRDEERAQARKRRVARKLGLPTPSCIRTEELACALPLSHAATQVCTYAHPRAKQDTNTSFKKPPSGTL